MNTAQQSLALVGSRADRARLADALEDRGGFRVTMALGMDEAASPAFPPSRHLDAIVLDVADGDDGAAACLRLRGDGMELPIVMLSHAGTEADVVGGLNAGAGDYMVKPYRVLELAARIRAQIRAYWAGERAVVPIGQYRLDPGTRMLTHPQDRRGIQLTTKEAEILRFLHQAGDTPTSRDTMLRQMGYRKGVLSHTVESHVYRLRKKLQMSIGAAPFVITDSNGYRLNRE